MAHQLMFVEMKTMIAKFLVLLEGRPPQARDPGSLSLRLFPSIKYLYTSKSSNKKVEFFESSGAKLHYSGLKRPICQSTWWVYMCIDRLDMTLVRLIGQNRLDRETKQIPELYWDRVKNPFWKWYVLYLALCLRLFSARYDKVSWQDAWNCPTCLVSLSLFFAVSVSFAFGYSSSRRALTDLEGSRRKKPSHHFVGFNFPEKIKSDDTFGLQLNYVRT